MGVETDILYSEVARLKADNARLTRLLSVTHAELETALLRQDRLIETIAGLQQTLQDVMPIVLRAEAVSDD